MNEFYIVSRPFESNGPWYAEGTGSTIFWGQSFNDAHKFKSVPEIQKYISALIKKPDLYQPLELNTWVITRYSSQRVDIQDIITRSHTMGLLRGGVK